MKISALVIAAVCLTVLMAASGFGQDMASDTTRPGPDSTSQGQDRPEDIQVAEKLPRIRAFDFDSTLNANILTARWNLNDELTRSFFHDAGDMLKFNASNQVIFYQNSPIRTTVAPFALPGNRINAIFDNRRLNPLEHIFEPDNRLDFNDIPTEHVQRVHNVEGPLGLALGGKNATSSLVMLPYEPDTTRIESRLMVDKGSFGYAYTKALLAHRNENGRLMRLSLGYRKANGAITGRDDNAYHHYYELEQPLFRRLEFKSDIRLYRRTGTFSPRADFDILNFNRGRRDRDINAGLYYNHNDYSLSSVNFRHQRSESKLYKASESYGRDIDVFDNGVTFAHHRKLNGCVARIRGEVAQEKFYERDNGNDDDRQRAFVDVLIHSGDEAGSLTLYGRGETVSGFDLSPSGQISFMTGSRWFSLSASAGYATIFPRLYDLKTSRRLEPVYSSTTNDYFETGNPELVPEKQLTGNVMVTVGPAGTDLSLSVTGGKITDAIDWIRFDTLGLEIGAYRPVNHDIEFVNGTLKQRLTLGKNIYWSGGGSYHYIKHDDNDNPPYSPEYQTFTNLELYYYVVPLELRLFAYGELLYSGPYTGINGAALGKEPIFNAKLSFQIKKFRFYYIFQNLLDRGYQAREDHYLIGRYNYYGITWEFLD